ncbi:MAG: sigma-70 family RNA polymerase sigma factor [Myxococcales bacterium]
MKVGARQDIHLVSMGDAPGERKLDVRAIFEKHGQFVWLCLQRHGVRPADLDDVAQEVFIIVHRKLHTLVSNTRVTTWLFGICTRVAANYRRLRRWSREVPSGGAIEDRPSTLMLAEEALIMRQQQELAEQALDKLDVAKRAAFVMFELEGMSCAQIAEMMGLPLGTVYSRLHAARRQLEKCLTGAWTSRSPG